MHLRDAVEIVAFLHGVGLTRRVGAGVRWRSVSRRGRRVGLLLIAPLLLAVIGRRILVGLRLCLVVIVAGLSCRCGGGRLVGVAGLRINLSLIIAAAVVASWRLSRLTLRLAVRSISAVGGGRWGLGEELRARHASK